MLEQGRNLKEQMNSYPVDKRLIQVFNSEIEWLQPIGNPIKMLRKFISIGKQY